ncbi:SDR family oxidoreductase [Herbaspirillum sp. VT-16-41]|uniref:UDP-glucose 4-epimerase family protein n=1 Tax=Herbaspirillum sp. VT-16-41 TaxID=1953765 RepID=UPI000980D173|nr:SDR family oxidoreductase [Herbaspirillum sp. VT-16-41]ONN67086.1 hypothetical protein BTM36_06975 [Herbaspirillum sp. VT-16-41]
MKRIAITGANGFVGKALCRRLKEEGNFVRAIIRASNGLSRGDVDELCVIGDIDAPVEWSALLSGVDVVIHLAARAHILKECSDDPLSAFRAVNTDATLRLGDAAQSVGVKRFVFLSSIGVNGTSTLGRSFSELDTPSPASDYAISKWEAEQGLFQLCSMGGMELVVIRPPLIYGPGAPGNFRVMLDWLNKGIPLPLGAVHNKRSLVGITNLADLITVCISHADAAGQVFLAGDGQDVSTSELLRLLGAAIGKPARLVPLPASMLQFGARMLGKSDLSTRLLSSLQVDISKAKTLLNWHPPVGLEAGLRDTAAAYMQLNEASS